MLFGKKWVLGIIDTIKIKEVSVDNYLPTKITHKRYIRRLMFFWCNINELMKILDCKDFIKSEIRLFWAVTHRGSDVVITGVLHDNRGTIDSY
jgi:hypothetical protein